ncbi:hypothetical protein [Tardiphaga sp. 709]|uniref:hypothetical protein n=1 Tax=Tardiphaga sp. 709 TaxID=3076039 RepID=UPI0028E3AA9E|nr:hypothetical protein [Tardiphaga sp. 709]WNV10166.1 hypothetical protein RSO67_02935 [Tardiphaga sp. 709]
MGALAKQNAKANDVLKGQTKRLGSHCQRGHAMTGDNVGFRTSRRIFCKACTSARAKAGGIISPQIIKQVTKLLKERVPIRRFTQGVSEGYLVSFATFKRYRRENPTFDQFVIEHTKDNNSRAQLQRYRHRAFMQAAPAVQSRYLREVYDLIPRYLPDDARDDIVSNIFRALVEQSLRHDQVKSRVAWFVSEQNRMFPPKHRKFGDAQLVSLDEVLFDDGTRTRGDTVSEGLW